MQLGKIITTSHATTGNIVSKINETKIYDKMF